MTQVSASYPVRFAQLAALWAYAVSQPIFSLIEGNPEFLVVRGSTRAEVVVFAVVLTVGPPFLAVLCERVVSHVAQIAGDVLHLFFFGLFVAPLAMRVLKLAEPGSSVAVLAATGLATLALLAYLRWRQVHTFLALLGVLPAVSLVIFVTGVRLPTEGVAAAHVAVPREVPIVVIVFDEFPASSLMTARGSLDAVRYPNFARLSRRATWYPRATTVDEHTTGAVPAILTGMLPEQDELPVLADHGENLFTLLGESYRMRVAESLTYLCPKRYCVRQQEPLLRRLSGLFSDVRVAFLQLTLPRSVRGTLPEVWDRWSGFRNRDRLLAADDWEDVDAIVANRTDGTQRQIDDFLAGFAAHEPPTVHFVHLFLPHTPWHLLPSGREYSQGTVDGLVDGWNRWGEDEWLVQQGYQRHLLQVGYTDRMLGRVLDRLERQGLYEQALVVLVADHGVSFQAGRSRRWVRPQNIADIARVPLFVKLPGQSEGHVDPRPVTTIDILPTIADALDVRLPWRVDGHSLLEKHASLSEVLVGKREGPPVRASLAEVDRRQTATLRRKAALFGEGSDSLYAIGALQGLLGRSLAELRVRTAETARVRFDGDALFADVDTSSSFVPARITGSIDGVDVGSGVELAIVVNGRIAALTRCFRVGGKQRFSALVSEDVFRDGFNKVELLSISGTPPMLHLTRLGSTLPPR